VRLSFFAGGTGSHLKPDALDSGSWTVDCGIGRPRRPRRPPAGSLFRPFRRPPLLFSPFPARPSPLDGGRKGRGRQSSRPRPRPPLPLSLSPSFLLCQGDTFCALALWCFGELAQQLVEARRLFLAFFRAGFKEVLKRPVGLPRLASG